MWLVYYCAFGEKFGPCVLYLRNFICAGILRGSPVLLSMQRLRSRPLNLLMGGVSFMGEEEFYTLLVPPIVWVFEARLGRLLALLMTAAFYCTGKGVWSGGGVVK